MPHNNRHYNRGCQHCECNNDDHEDATATVDKTVSMDVKPMQIMNRKEYKERFAVAEALARTSMLTSPAARRRLAARKVEIDMMSGWATVGVGNEDEGYWTADMDYIPPKQLLMYMVR